MRKTGQKGRSNVAGVHLYSGYGSCRDVFSLSLRAYCNICTIELNCTALIMYVKNTSKPKPEVR